MTEHTTLQIAFVHQDRAGILAVQYGPNDSVTASGFDLLQGRGFDVSMCLGYPTMRAWVSAYAGSGYRTLLAWIQIVTDHYYGRTDDEAPAHVVAEIDASPALRALGVPFFAYGYPAAIYDAPCNNLGAHARLEWAADTFLVTFPSPLNDNEIAFLAGFRWGYAEWDEGGQRQVALRPLMALERTAWEAHLPMLQRECPAWRYA
jgi:hypothetical protein